MILRLCLEIRTNHRPLRNDSYVVGAKKKRVGRREGEKGERKGLRKMEVKEERKKGEK